MNRLLISLLGAAAGTSYAAVLPQVSGVPQTSGGPPQPSGVPQIPPTGVSRARTSPPPSCLTVGATGQYHTVGAALSALGSSTLPACIYIAQGIYPEQIVVSYRGPLTVYGETTDTSSYKANTVTITHTISSQEAGTLDDSATLRVRSKGFKMHNVNVVNGLGPGAQALALSADAPQLGFYGCQFRGYQDTVFTKTGSQFFYKSLIEGSVDYIFGGSAAWFDQCDIRSNSPGYITASGREVADSSWLAFDRCTIGGIGNANLKGLVNLGRPWRPLARVIYQNSELSDVVSPKGWTPMAKDATPFFYEFGNTGEGSNTSQREYLSPINAAVTIETVLGPDANTWVEKPSF
ncbi:pectin lyase fold/virulence factor [Aspergillus coremiiformis]|uniref:Pectinesterase n=1 Tax=Aspergillus coremiiformis TaxID=138285 RepID=A0A5N6Z6Y1_9EURO|nr:pectin lyase fold/virulence factor [Aspergillus coremiiformis]